MLRHLKKSHLAHGDDTSTLSNINVVDLLEVEMVEGDQVEGDPFTYDDIVSEFLSQQQVEVPTTAEVEETTPTLPPTAEVEETPTATVERVEVHATVENETENEDVDSGCFSSYPADSDDDEDESASSSSKEEGTDGLDEDLDKDKPKSGTKRPLTTNSTTDGPMLKKVKPIESFTTLTDSYILQNNINFLNIIKQEKWFGDLEELTIELCDDVSTFRKDQKLLLRRYSGQYNTEMGRLPTEDCAKLLRQFNKSAVLDDFKIRYVAVIATRYIQLITFYSIIKALFVNSKSVNLTKTIFSLWSLEYRTLCDIEIVRLNNITPNNILHNNRLEYIIRRCLLSLYFIRPCAAKLFNINIHNSYYWYLRSYMLCLIEEIALNLTKDVTIENISSMINNIKKKIPLSQLVTWEAESTEVHYDTDYKYSDSEDDSDEE